MVGEAASKSQKGMILRSFAGSWDQSELAGDGARTSIENAQVETFPNLLNPMSNYLI